MAQRVPCKNCGTLLNKADHVRLKSLDTVQTRVWDSDDAQMRRQSRTDARFEFTPCPNCGHARPIPGSDNRIQLAIFFAVVLAIMGSLLAIMIFAP